MALSSSSNNCTGKSPVNVGNSGLPPFLFGSGSSTMPIPPIIFPGMFGTMSPVHFGTIKLPFSTTPSAVSPTYSESASSSNCLTPTESSDATLATDDDDNEYDYYENVVYRKECGRCGKECGCDPQDRVYFTRETQSVEHDDTMCEMCGGYCECKTRDEYDGCDDSDASDDECIPANASMRSLISKIPIHVLMDYDRIDEPLTKAQKPNVQNKQENVARQIDVQNEQSNDGECTHPKVDFSTCACMLCGVVLNSDYVSSLAQVNDFEESRYVRGKTVRKTPLYPDGLDLPFDKEVINRASAISDSLKMQGNRINRLKMRRFACLYLALRELNRKYNLHDVADAVGLKRTDMSPAITLFSSIQSGYKPPREAIMNLSEHASITMAIGRAEALKIDPESRALIRYLIIKAIKFHGSAITRRQSETIASGALSVFREITGLDLPPENLFITKISESTLKSVHDEIMEAYNMS